MPGEEIIDGVEYEVIEESTNENIERRASASGREKDEDKEHRLRVVGRGGDSRSGNGVGTDERAEPIGASGVEYARALQIYGADGADRAAGLEVAILGWLDAKRGRSGSLRTARTYADTLAVFREALRREGLDLDASPTPVALVAQAWAGKSEDNSAPAPTTYNQRLACVSSFYRYARKQGILEHNPIERVERRGVQAYAGSKALKSDDISKAMNAIDRTTPTGARDYALLHVYLQTGRRLSEVAALELRDLEDRGGGGNDGGKVRITFRRCKGGKVLYDTLSAPISAALRAYLHIIYGPDLKAVQTVQANAPVWVSLAERNGTRGGRLSKVSISRICKARLGTSRVHALRHTMAQVMEQRRAPVSLIQQRLGHSSLATTGIYLAALRDDDNPYADELGEAFGAGSTGEPG
ncbi:MAG: tyrosine-type recombinase/integrase [Chloroflexi bacterium]|nr:tyrosine-type recombinase/integrase [Chloroflexota bacterium]